MKVSIDYDGTLSRRSVQNYVHELIRNGIDVYITTSIFDSDHLKELKFLNYTNSDLFEIVDKLGIDVNNVHFTNMNLKSEYLFNKGFIFHLDDDSIELSYINNDPNSDVVGINVNNEFYENVCNSLIDL
jgi:hypothetical protein